mmetsp:Transcript_32620/g.76001  ORF Transcript_32620/g.76001 Transcript_32620/m.76001 type:complete len:983 (-) Transcript_32620:1453-4401(-)
MDEEGEVGSTPAGLTLEDSKAMDEIARGEEEKAGQEQGMGVASAASVPGGRIRVAEAEPTKGPSHPSCTDPEQAMDLSEYARGIKPPPTFSLRGPLFHAMISYRVATESMVAQDLYDKLRSLSASSKPLPPGGKGLWCAFAKEPDEPNGAKIYLDHLCLLNGKPWRAGFIMGLAHSMVVVPLLTWSEKDGEERGTVGGLVSLGEKDRVDNCLLEMIVTMEWMKQRGSALHSVVPLMFGECLDPENVNKGSESGSDASQGASEGAKPKKHEFTAFPWKKLGMLPSTPSDMTNKCAAVILKNLGVSHESIKAMEGRTVKQNIDMMLANQGIKPDELQIQLGDNKGSSKASSDKNQKNKAEYAFVVERCADTVLDVIIRDISEAKSSPQHFGFDRPHGAEVLEWLKQQGLLHLAPAFARSGINSIRLASRLSSDKVSEMIDSWLEGEQSGTMQAARVLGEKVAVETAVKGLASDVRSNTMARRLWLYKDTKATWMQLATSKNSFEVAVSKFVPQTLIFILGIFTSVFITARLPSVVRGVLDYEPLDGEGRVYLHRIVTVPLQILLCLSSFAVVFVSRFRSPYEGHLIVQKAVALWVFLNFAQVIIEAAQLLMDEYVRTEQFWFESLAGGHLWDGVVSSILFSGFLYTVVHRQDIAWLIFFPLWAVVRLTTAAMTEFVSKNQVIANGFISNWLVGIIVLVIYIFFMFWLWLSNRTASQTVREDAEAYNTKWLHLTKDSSGKELGGDFPHTSRVHQEPSPTSADRASSVDPQQPERKEPSPEENREALDDLNKAPQQPKKKEQTDEGGRIGELERGPVKQCDRAIQKCVRSYCRDPSRLTDLVRCQIVVESLSELVMVVKRILNVSAHHGEPERENMNEDGKAESYDLVDKMVKVTCVKNRFDDSEDGIKESGFNMSNGYRDLSLNLEFGWTWVEGCFTFLPVRDWSSAASDTHICELQIRLKPMQDAVSSKGGHANYERWRDLRNK